jgi:hypothetical protein
MKEIGLLLPVIEAVIQKGARKVRERVLLSLRLHCCFLVVAMLLSLIKLPCSQLIAILMKLKCRPRGSLILVVIEWSVYETEHFGLNAVFPSPSLRLK